MLAGRDWKKQLSLGGSQKTPAKGSCLEITPQGPKHHSHDPEASRKRREWQRKWLRVRSPPNDSREKLWMGPGWLTCPTRMTCGQSGQHRGQAQTRRPPESSSQHRARQHPGRTGQNTRASLRTIRVNNLRLRLGRNGNAPFCLHGTNNPVPEY